MVKWEGVATGRAGTDNRTGLTLPIGGAPRLSPDRLYPHVEGWLQAMGVAPHATARRALAEVVVALLTAQSLAPAELARTLPSPRAVPARSRHKRRTRALERPWLTSAALTPALVRAALALVPQLPGQATTLVLDGVRCGGWEALVVGARWRGRVLPVAWAVLPYPWPKGEFTPTVCALLRHVAACWPSACPVHLLADRGFPSRAFFRTLAALRWGFTVRLPARAELTVAGEKRWARELIAATPVGRWAAFPQATYGQATPAVSGTVVVGRPLRVVPAHQANAGGLRHRAAQAARRAVHVAHKHRRPDASVETDEWVVLFTTHTTAAAAQAAYRPRWAIEGSFRDAQGGWDGQHGWDLEPTMAAAPSADRVDALCGLWALGALVQTWLGAATLAPEVPEAVAAEAAGWTTTGRVSLWARGRFVLRDGSGRLDGWAEATLRAGAAQIALVPPVRWRPVPLPGAATRPRATAPPAVTGRRPAA
jgi:hypothetical protein